ncbi:MAG: SEC-C domain-containing protein [Desulfobacula sp.]|nr:SEC-C domain-containing protein [Desulfobacula sp.]
MGWLSQLFKNNGQERPAILPRKNDLCWCGSGLKYKKCHLAKDKRYFKEHPNPKKKATVKKSCGPVFG